MSATIRWTWLACLVSATTVAWGQETYDDPDGEPRRDTRVPSEGFWFTPKMLDRVIDRVTEDAGMRYGFDEDQLYNARLIIKERVPRWLEQNRGEIQTLVNQYFEALLNDEPPDPAYVAEWSGRVLPLLNEFRNQMVGESRTKCAST